MDQSLHSNKSQLTEVDIHMSAQGKILCLIMEIACQRAGAGPRDRACLVSTRPWAPFPALHEANVIAHVCNPSTREIEAGGSEVT